MEVLPITFVKRAHKDKIKRIEKKNTTNICPPPKAFQELQALLYTRNTPDYFQSPVVSFDNRKCQPSSRPWTRSIVSHSFLRNFCHARRSNSSFSPKLLPLLAWIPNNDGTDVTICFRCQCGPSSPKLNGSRIGRVPFFSIPFWGSVLWNTRLIISPIGYQWKSPCVGLKRHPKELTMGPPQMHPVPPSVSFHAISRLPASYHKVVTCTAGPLNACLCFLAGRSSTPGPLLCTRRLPQSSRRNHKQSQSVRQSWATRKAFWGSRVRQLKFSRISKWLLFAWLDSFNWAFSPGLPSLSWSHNIIMDRDVIFPSRQLGRTVEPPALVATCCLLLCANIFCSSDRKRVTTCLRYFPL